MPDPDSVTLVAPLCSTSAGDRGLVIPAKLPPFTGRDRALPRLLADPLATRTSAVLPRALFGLGGVGKAQLAIEYVYRHSAECDTVWWIPSKVPSHVRVAVRN